MASTSDPTLRYPAAGDPFTPRADIENLARDTKSGFDAFRKREGVKVNLGTARVVNVALTWAVGGWAAPGAVADPQSFYSTANQFEPIVIPNSLPGFYLITAQVGLDQGSGTRGYIELRVNSDGAGRTVFTGDDRGLLTIGRSLAGGDRLKIEIYTAQGGNTVPSRTSIEARRIGI